MKLLLYIIIKGDIAVTSNYKYMGEENNQVKINNDTINNTIEPLKQRKKKIIREVLEWVFCFIIAYVIYLTISYFFGTISGVKMESMTPTTVQGERLLVQRPTVFKKDIKYGDIITFEAPLDLNIMYKPDTGNDNNIAKYKEYEGFNQFLYSFVGIGQMTYVKRVIGLEGDHIVIGDDGYVYRNDEKLEEPYLKDGTTNQKGVYLDVVVPKGCVYVMGDNRLGSKDSRIFGCVPVSKVNGYVIMRVWPFDKFGKIS